LGKWTKHIGRKPVVQRAVAGLAAGLISLMKATTRWQTVNGTAAEAAWKGEKPVIAAFWHNRLALVPVCWPSPEPFHMLISSHPDGRLIANTIAHFGFSSVPGSSTRGGGEALRNLVRHLKGGASVGVTPDGPRGPRMRANDGVLALGRLAGVPVVPVSVSVSNRIVLGTWDHLIVPLPFGRGAIVWGEPIVVPRDADDEAMNALRLKLEDALNTVSAQADALVGHEAFTPAEAVDARA
jgi:lysophospholipid acyltransferase (LPLAT)-like uncharacterized protein